MSKAPEKIYVFPDPHKVTEDWTKGIWFDKYPYTVENKTIYVKESTHLSELKQKDEEIERLRGQNERIKDHYNDSESYLFGQIEKLEARVKLAEKYIEESPCDPDIYDDQLKAYNEWKEFIKKNQ